MPTSPNIVNSQSLPSNPVVISNREAGYTAEGTQTGAAKHQNRKSGFLLAMSLIVGMLAMLILITVKAPPVIFGVLTIKAVLLMIVLSKRI